jgi:hypothetical protein
MNDVTKPSVGITEEQMVNALLNHYREQGLNMVDILDNPEFAKLPLASKVSILKNNASALASGGNGLTSREKKDAMMSLAIDSAMGAATGYLTGRAIHNIAVQHGGKLGLGWGVAIAGGTALGLVGGATKALLPLHDLRARRNRYYNAVQALSNKPGASTEDALKTYLRASPSPDGLSKARLDESLTMLNDKVGVGNFAQMADKPLRAIARLYVPAPTTPSE